MLTAQSHQKSFTDQRRKFLEFDEGDHVFLRVTPTGVDRAIKTKKLNPRYIGPFQILKRIELVAYRISLALSNLHDIFHILQLWKYTSDANHVLELESVWLREDLTLQVTPVRIDDPSVKRLHGKKVNSSNEKLLGFAQLSMGNGGIYVNWKVHSVGGICTPCLSEQN
ncbi:uncharacterized protein LOC107636736 [Arachis ipaensis]|uniref:uncharacterized protein LOC107636736 n=1 Tax=Arachis ipaensis TaxID=130454 RepID=UPI0007AF1370|nr:uncharacterized protein LOC107636736 [Arachis ipaensis]XP_025647823.1 uncharacterized protein LOC112742801 [Arachis hypogaea]